jgi:hypothetical protein
MLRDRSKKDEKDTPPNLVALIDAGLKDGKNRFKVEGNLSRIKDASVIFLEAAQAAEKKKSD